MCGINLPNEIRFQGKCALHPEETLDWISNAHPDEDWQEKLVQLKQDLEQSDKDAELIRAVDTTIREREGQLFLSSWDVIRSGMSHRLKPLDLVRVGADVYEIIGYRHSSREYWVRRFSTRLSTADLAELASSGVK